MSEILYVVIPAYNESNNIENVINDWYPIVEEHSFNGLSRLVIIDDGSKDNTYQILEKKMEKYKYLDVISKKNEGHGAAIYDAYHYAIENGADFIFQTDSDGQTSSKEFERFWNMRNEYNLIIGHRNKREDGLSRVFVTKVLKFVIGIIFRESIVDANTPFRLMTCTSLKECINFVPEKYFLTNIILSVVYQKRAKKVLYIPITFKKRQGGINSIDLKKIVKIGRKALTDFVIINKSLQRK